MDQQIFSGKYHIQREIASGGMGVVYHAIDLALRREIAIKILHPQYSTDPSFTQRFLREARGMARLDHPNIIRIYAVEKEQVSHYIVMEYFPGKDLKHILRERGPLSLTESLQIAIEVTKALAYAHQKHIVHRDIKPGNIMVGEGANVKITDFGIAAALDESSATVTGTIMGTPEYMSPEQAKGEQVDAGSDLYSFGIVLYEMLTGTTPYKGIAGASIVGRLAFDQSDLDLSLPSHTPASLQYLIRGLTKKDPRNRIKDAILILETLQDHLNKPKEPSLHSQSDSPPQPPFPTPEGSTDTQDTKGTQSIEAKPQESMDVSRVTNTTTLRNTISQPTERIEPILSSHPQQRSHNITLSPELTENTSRQSKNIWRNTVGLIVFIVLTVGGMAIFRNWPIQETKQPSSQSPFKVEETFIERRQQPTQKVDPNEQRANAVIQELEEIHRKYMNEYARQRERARVFFNNTKDLQFKIKRTSQESTNLSNDQDNENLQYHVKSLRQEAKKKQVHQKRMEQTLNQEAQNVLIKANAAVLMDIEDSKREQLQTSRREVVTAQLQLKNQHKLFERNSKAELAALTSAITRAREPIEEAKRQVGLTQVEPQLQKAKVAEDRRANTVEAITSLYLLNREFQDEQSRRQASGQTLLDQGDQLVARLTNMSSLPENGNSQRKLDSVEQNLKNLRRQFLDDQRQHETAQGRLSTKTQEALRVIEKIDQTKLDATQRGQLEMAQKDLLRAQQRLKEQQSRLSSKIEAKIGIVQTSFQRTRTTLQTKTLTRLLQNFESAYQKRDLHLLQNTTSIDGRRIRFLQSLFKTYSTIEINTEIQTITDKEAVVKVVITKLVDQKGKNVKPSPIIRETIVKVPKDGETWGKIQW